MNAQTLAILLIYIHSTDSDMTKISGEKYYFNSCPCGLSEMEFYKAYSSFVFTNNKEKILSQLNRVKRSETEFNYTIIVEKVPRYLSEQLKLKDYISETDFETSDGNDTEANGDTAFSDFLSSFNYDDLQSLDDFDLYDFQLGSSRDDYNFQKVGDDVIASGKYKQDSPWQITIGNAGKYDPKTDCIGAFLNRQFAIARKSCLKNLNEQALKIRANAGNMCTNSTKIMDVEKVHYFALDDLAILEIPKVNASVRNYAICLPGLGTWFLNQSKLELEHGRVFGHLDCHLVDSFVQFKFNNKTNPECLTTTNNSTTHYCTSSPDLKLCEWSKVGPLLTIPDLDRVKLVGIASGSSTCQHESVMLDFIPINEVKTMIWIIKTIALGECF